MTKIPDGYIRVTEFISQFKQPFDKMAISKKCAAKTGRPQDEILDEWDKKRDFACAKGTALHDAIDDYIVSGNSDGVPDQVRAIIDSEDIMAHEERLNDPTIRLSGAFDLLQRTEKGKVRLIDWKSSAKINRTSPYKKFMKYPLHGLEDLNFNHYSLQAGIYCHMLESCKGIVVDEFHLVHVGRYETQVYQCDMARIRQITKMIISPRRREIAALAPNQPLSL